MAFTDSTKYSCKAGSYVSKKTGETVKTWELGGLTSWKTVSVKQGEEVEVTAWLKRALADMERIAGKRVQIDEAAVKLNRAKASREAFMVIYQKYPQALEPQKAVEDAAVAEAELEFTRIIGG